ncbi:MAG: LysM peptidoglycan-binding domain-containing protein, partial [Candidatus Acidiferrum sp.]
SNAALVWDRSRQRLHAGAILFAACAFSASAPVWAQDVAEAARLEQARKDKQAKKKHVYTEEDLKRARILTREDRELLDAKKREQPVPGPATPAADMDAQALGELPSGDVARMYRAIKELSLDGQIAEFHLPEANAVAAPKPGLVLRDFVAQKPNLVPSKTTKAPVAPIFKDNVIAFPKTEFVGPQPPAVQPVAQPVAIQPMRMRPAIVQPIIAKMPSAPVVATIVPGRPMREFVAARPLPVEAMKTSQPVAPVFSEPTAAQSVIVKRGDSLWKLAQVNLGDGNRWRELLAVNPGLVDPHHIVPGTAINIGGNGLVVPVAPAAPTDSTITVRKGDSLWKIAKLQLGSGGFWGCIAKANRAIRDANRIYAGQTLNLPSSCETRK